MQSEELKSARVEPGQSASFGKYLVENAGKCPVVVLYQKDGTPAGAGYHADHMMLERKSQFHLRFREKLELVKEQQNLLPGESQTSFAPKVEKVFQGDLNEFLADPAIPAEVKELVREQLGQSLGLKPNRKPSLLKRLAKYFP